VGPDLENGEEATLWFRGHAWRKRKGREREVPKRAEKNGVGVVHRSLGDGVSHGRKKGGTRG